MKPERETRDTTILNLQVFKVPQADPWPAKIPWEIVVFQTEPQRKFYMEHYDSPEKRLRNKNPAPFRL